MKKEFKRCFIAINFHDNIIDEIIRIQKIIQKEDVFIGKFTENDNLHLTMKFLGEIDEDKITKIKESLKKIKFKRFECSLEKLGVFSMETPRIIWIKIKGEIYNFCKEVDECLSDIFEKEKRFMGHITLARIKKIYNKKKLYEVLNKIKIEKLKISVEEFSLMESKLTERGAEYKEIEKYKLKR
jgi:2'-5' RNA ligase